MNYQLSICIPTYNREQYLKQLLDCICNQLKDVEEKVVEICVSDNASTDNKWSEKGERCMVPGKCLSSVLPRGDDRSVKLDPKVSPV